MTGAFSFDRPCSCEVVMVISGFLPRNQTTLFCGNILGGIYTSLLTFSVLRQSLGVKVDLTRVGLMNKGFWPLFVDSNKRYGTALFKIL